MIADPAIGERMSIAKREPELVRQTIVVIGGGTGTSFETARLDVDDEQSSSPRSQ